MLVSSSRPSPYQAAFLLGETILILAATILALYTRVGQMEELFTWRYSWHRILLVPLVLEITFYYSDLHNFRIARPFVWTVARVAQAAALGTIALAVIYYLVPRMFLGRGVLGLVFLYCFLLVVIWRALYSWALKQRLFSTRLLVLGSGNLADSIFEELVSRSDNIYNVVCIVTTDQTGGRRADDPPPDTEVDLSSAWARLLRCDLSSESEDLPGLTRYYNVSMVVVAMDEKRGRMPLEALLRCRMQGNPVISGEAFYEAVSGRILADRIRPSWLIFSSGFSTGTLIRLSKRTFDLFFSSLGLILALPLTILTALAVRLEGKGPVIYRQERVGQYGKAFTIYKFRSMRTGAEDETGPVWSSENDERVTRVGRFIRKTRLDEIPQMWNVLLGHMSFVGPRPERPHFVAQLEKRLPYYQERHNVKPGITGWAQICYPYGASEGAALEKLNYDLYYIKHASLSMDIMIVLQTLKLLLFGGGGR